MEAGHFDQIMSSHRSSPEVREPTPPRLRCAAIASAPFWRCCPSLCVAAPCALPTRRRSSRGYGPFACARA
eukprot:scaffold28191_cov107-Phaeocystis_antarctica.AAC.1